MVRFTYHDTRQADHHVTAWRFKLLEAAMQECTTVRVGRTRRAA